MNRLHSLGLTLAIAVAISLIPHRSLGALLSRVYTFSDGNVLTASQLNTEFNNLVDGANSLTDANISSGAAIDPVKISSTIAGGGITRNVSTGALSVVADDSTVEFSGLTLRAKDSGITSTKILDGTIVAADVAASLAGSGLAGGAGTDFSVNVDGTGIEINSDTLRLKDSGVTSAKILDGTIAAGDLGTDSVVTAKIADLNITEQKLGPAAVATAKILDANVTQVKLYKRTVTGSNDSGNTYLSGSSGVYTTTASSITPVTNMSIAMTTTGRPVMVCPVSDGGESIIYSSTADAAGVTCSFQMDRGGTLIGGGALVKPVTGVLMALPLPGCAIDYPSAGSYTYTFSLWRSSGGAGTCGINYAKLFVYEIN